jgi:hypothetical protein
MAQLPQPEYSSSDSDAVSMKLAPRLSSPHANLADDVSSPVKRRKLNFTVSDSDDEIEIVSPTDASTQAGKSKQEMINLSDDSDLELRPRSWRPKFVKGVRPNHNSDHKSEEEDIAEEIDEDRVSLIYVYPLSLVSESTL